MDFLYKIEGKDGVYCKSCADELALQDIVKRKCGGERVFPNGYAFGEEWSGCIYNVEEVIAWMHLTEVYEK